MVEAECVLYGLACPFVVGDTCWAHDKERLLEIKGLRDGLGLPLSKLATILYMYGPPLI